MARKPLILGILLFGAYLLASCAPVAPTASVPKTPEVTQALPTAMPTSPTPITSPVPAFTPTAQIEARQIELEWPATLRMGESDVVRLALIPTSAGYVVQAEFPEHLVENRNLPIQRISGYDLSVIARLDAVGFLVAPQGELASYLPPGETIAWRWTLTPREIGRQRLAVSLVLRWTPSTPAGPVREAMVYSRGFEVRVLSFLGLSRGQATTAGVVGLVLGSGLSLAAITRRRRPPRAASTPYRPNPNLAIELHSGLQISADDRLLVSSLFHRYDRLVLESEFLSGYSGARTYLALPIRPDGRCDAHTIVKIGDSESIRREFENYETFVKDTLPPITARIQHPPVAGPGGRQAAIRYTFIAEPGSPPISLRRALLANPDASLLAKLFKTFGPSWWMQRRAYTFQLAQEYDRLLPTHYVVEPTSARGRLLDGRISPVEISLTPGEYVTLRNFQTVERRPDGKSLSLRGSATAGQPPLRVRWLGLSDPNGATGKVVATRQSLLEGIVQGFDRFGLPDPLAHYPALLEETIGGTQSTIHGDLNLENILVGPGNMVWLVDFAQTRDGHTLCDFAHLEAELIAHILAPQIRNPADYLSLLEGNPESVGVHLRCLIDELHLIAQRCLFNPSIMREYWLALFMSCLGALKFTNLDDHARHLLYLTAGYLCLELDK